MQWYLVNALSSGETISSNGNYTQSMYLKNNSYVLTMATDYRAEKYHAQWYHPYSLTLGVNCINNSRFTTFASITSGKAIIYPLSEISPVLSFNGSVTMNINEKIWLSYDLTYVRYSHSRLDYWDPEYNLMNLKNYVAILNNLSLSQGVSMINYDVTMAPDREYLGNLGYYVNLDWQIGQNYHVYAGYKSQYSNYSIQSGSDLITDASNFYLKIQLGF